MQRAVVPWTLTLVLLTIGLGSIAALVLVVAGVIVPPWHAAPAERPGINTAPRNARLLREKLSKPVTLEGVFSDMALGRALEQVSSRAGVPLVINHAAFAADGVFRVEEQPVHLAGTFSVNLNLDATLRLLLTQVRGDRYTGTYRLRDDGLEITTTAERTIAAAHWEKGERSPVPRLDVTFDGQALDEALLEVAARTGVNLELDSRVAHVAHWQRIDAAYHHLPVENAVRLLADKANLKVVTVGSCLSVTSAEQARDFEAKGPRRLHTKLRG